MNGLSVKAKLRIHNRFDIVSTNTETGEKRQVAQAENILLNQFWTYFKDSSGWASYIWLGSGTGALDPARTALFSPVTSKSSTAENIDFSLMTDGIFSVRRYIVLSEIENNGVLFSEVGVGSITRPHTHALLMDMNGNPVTIEKTNLEILTIYATTYAYIDPALWQEKKVIIPWYVDTESAVYVSEFANLILGSSPSNLWGTVNTYMCVSDTILCSLYIHGRQSTPVYKSSTMSISWSAANKKMYSPTLRWGVGEANGRSIRSVGIISQADNKYGVLKLLVGLVGNPDWSGAFIEGESVGVGDGTTVDFVTSWGFIHSGAIVYVNGIEQTSGVSVDIGIPKVNRLDYFVNPIKVDNWNLIPGILNNQNARRNGAECVVENPYYASVGIDLMNVGYCVLYCSNDLENWTLIADRKSLGATDVDTSTYRNYRYWKIVKPSDSSYPATYWSNFRSSQLTAARNIHFDVAPAEDAVITMDYTTDECPKDANYVLDTSFELVFDEYTEE